MSSKNWIAATIMAVVLSLSSSAFAKWECPNTTYASAAYLGVSLGYAHTNWCDTDYIMHELGYTDTDIKDGCYGGRAFVGYDFNEHFSAEVGYSYVRNQIEYVFKSNGVTFKDCIGHRMYDAVMKMRVYLDSGFSIYTKVGVAYVEACDAYQLRFPTDRHDPSNTNLTFGGGFAYCLTPNWNATADWQHYRGNDDTKCWLADLDFFTLGIAYKFAC